MLDLSIYLVTDRSLAVTAGHDPVQMVLDAVAGGVTTVQIREKHAADAEIFAYLEAISRAIPAYVGLIINDHIDIYLAARAAGLKIDGVHVGQSDMSPSQVRERVGPGALIGLSAATAAELSEAESAAQLRVPAVDYVGIGAINDTSTKLDAPPTLGVSGFSDLVSTLKLPAVAIGGIGFADVAPLRTAGAAGVAVVSLICAANSPLHNAQKLSHLWAGAALE